MTRSLSFIVAAVAIPLITALLLPFLTQPHPSTTTIPKLANRGVKNRSVGGTITSRVATRMLESATYDRVAPLVPYVHEASHSLGVPAPLLLAVLYEEALHRKPIDIETHGVAQLGIGELTAQGLPPDVSLLENDRFAVWLLGRKLLRLKLETGSFTDALTLHNGYTDFASSVEKRSRDPLLLSLLSQRRYTPMVSA